MALGRALFKGQGCVSLCSYNGKNVVLTLDACKIRVSLVVELLFLGSYQAVPREQLWSKQWLLA